MEIYKEQLKIAKFFSSCEKKREGTDILIQIDTTYKYVFLFF